MTFSVTSVGDWVGLGVCVVLVGGAAFVIRALGRSQLRPTILVKVGGSLMLLGQLIMPLSGFFHSSRAHIYGVDIWAAMQLVGLAFCYSWIRDVGQKRREAAAKIEAIHD